MRGLDMFEFRDASSPGPTTSKNSLVLGTALYNDQFLRTRPNFAGRIFQSKLPLSEPGAEAVFAARGRPRQGEHLLVDRGQTSAVDHQ
jgi:hypothetical protein